MARTTRRERAAHAVIGEISEYAFMLGLTLAALDEAHAALTSGDLSTAELYASVAAVELRLMVEGERE